jgi:hypothetical protein
VFEAGGGDYDKVRQVTKQETLMHQDREITLEELHQLVRSKATMTMAKEFGLSDVFYIITKALLYKEARVSAHA